MSINSGQRYKITNEENGLVLDLSGSNGKSILGWDFHGGAPTYDFHGGGNQQWITERQDDGQWTFRSVRHKKYLGFENTLKNGTSLEGLDQPQLWDIEILPGSKSHDNPRVKLRVPGTLFVVDSPRQTSNRGPVQLWEAWDAKNQIWVLEEYS